MDKNLARKVLVELCGAVNPIHRDEISKSLEIPRTTMFGLLSSLEDAGVVRKKEHLIQNRGRPPIVWESTCELDVALELLEKYDFAKNKDTSLSKCEILVPSVEDNIEGCGEEPIEYPDCQHFLSIESLVDKARKLSDATYYKKLRLKSFVGYCKKHLCMICILCDHCEENKKRVGSSHSSKVLADA